MQLKAKNMEMKNIDKLPSGNGVIGVREIQKGMKSGDVTHVVIAKNCPNWLVEKIANANNVETFKGNERELGTAIGKAFAVAMVGFKE